MCLDRKTLIYISVWAEDPSWERHRSFSCEHRVTYLDRGSKQHIIIWTGGLFDMPCGFRMKTGPFYMDSNEVLLGQSTPLDTSVGFTA